MLTYKYYFVKEITASRNVAKLINTYPWQRQWEETTKGAITKEFFFPPSVESRLAVNLKLSPNVTTIMTGHGTFDLTCIDSKL